MNSSDLTGDLCSDTRPTTQNFDCSDPVETDECTTAAYINTPYTFAAIFSHFFQLASKSLF
jgi:hypothetical protein